MSSLKHALSCLSCLTLLTSATAWANPATDGQWHGAVSLGGSLSGGNTSNRVLTGMGDAARGSASDKLSLYGQLNYGSAATDDGPRSTTANNLRLGARYDRELGGPLFGFGLGELQTNKVAGLRSRESVQGGVGYHVIRSADTTFDLFAGVGYAHARYVNLPTGSGATVVLGEESSHQLSPTTSFKQRLTMQLAGGELGRLSTWDLSLANAISGGWTANVGLSLRHASVVAPGARKTDSLLTFGLGYKF